jgi:hypothetical protein
VVTASSISFTGLSLSVPDGGTTTLTLKLTVKTTLPVGIDNTSFQFQVLPAGVTPGNSLISSQFGTFPAALSVSTENRVEVVATNLAFTDQPATSGSTGQNLAPVAVTARDANGNTDLDYTGAVTLSSTTFTLSSTDAGGLTQNGIAGVASWANLSSSTSGTGTVDAARVHLSRFFRAR